jgi:uncharacterized repeat protein (TIGR03803 family)
MTSIVIAKTRCFVTLAAALLLGVASDVRADQAPPAANDYQIIHTFYQDNQGWYPNGSLVQTSDGWFYGTTGAGGQSDQGVLFRVKADGTYERVLSFNDPDQVGPLLPVAGLIHASDGLLYGTSAGGGEFFVWGTVYSFDPVTHAIVVLHSFGSNEDGIRPYAPLIQANDGNFYGTTYMGGKFNGGIVFKVSPTGEYATLHSFPNGATPLGALVQGRDGFLYGSTSAGGAFGLGTIFRMSLNGKTKTLHTFDGQAGDGCMPTSELVEDAKGYFWGTAMCGTKTSGQVFKINAKGKFIVVHNFRPTEGGGTGNGLILADDGAFYGTWYGTNSGAGGTVFKTLPNGKTTILHTFEPNEGEGASPVGKLTVGQDGLLYGVTISGYGNLGTIYSLPRP